MREDRAAACSDRRRLSSHGVRRTRRDLGRADRRPPPVPRRAEQHGQEGYHPSIPGPIHPGPPRPLPGPPHRGPRRPIRGLPDRGTSAWHHRRRSAAAAGQTGGRPGEGTEPRRRWRDHEPGPGRSGGVEAGRDARGASRQRPSLAARGAPGPARQPGAAPGGARASAANAGPAASPSVPQLGGRTRAEPAPIASGAGTGATAATERRPRTVPAAHRGAHGDAEQGAGGRGRARRPSRSGKAGASEALGRRRRRGPRRPARRAGGPDRTSGPARRISAARRRPRSARLRWRKPWPRRAARGPRA